jgi:hypothetical protein
MKTTTRALGVALAAGMLSASFLAGPAWAQERRDRRYEHYHNPHWVLDDRYRHGHYYPAPGYAVSVLPDGNVVVNYRNGRYFYHSGVWFRPLGPRYVVVRPPVGISVAVLPSGYTTLWARGVPYYYANDSYYVQGPGGYVVAEPPPDLSPSAQVPPSASYPSQPAVAPPAAQPAPGSWFYCESAGGYYPYVRECREGWRTVPASPPASAPRP